MSKTSKSAPARIRVALAAALLPPEDLSYSDWAEKNFRLPAVSSADSGEFIPWKFQRGILDAMGDVLLPRVSIIKSARTGFTKSFVASIGAFAVNDPCPMILLVPTDDDARGYAVDEIDPCFRESPALRDVMKVGRFDGRNTLTHRSMAGGGSLKIIAARAPRNLRRHTAKVLVCDEVDGMEITKEGDPIKIAEMRTLTYADRKIIMGSTPKDDATSIIQKRYDESDQRVFEIPCVHCEEPFELLWDHLRWEEGKPETVQAYCPNCGCGIEERHKAAMVEAGEWRATKPEVKGHAGFRLNALISMFANAAWPELVKEFVQAEKNGDADMQPFVNTVLGKTWQTSVEKISEDHLMARREDFSLVMLEDKSGWVENIPADVAYITAGVDPGGDRIEITLLGHSPTHRFVLGHIVVFGSPNFASTWDEVRSILMTTWKHPFGGQIAIEATGVDSGGHWTSKVYDFCEPLQGIKVFAIKGDEGPRKTIEISKKRRRNRTAPLYIVGVDSVKTDIVSVLPKGKETPQAIRLSNTLNAEYMLQLTAERRMRKFKAGRPFIGFDRIGKRRAEALDCLVYAIAIKDVCKFDFEARSNELRGSKPKKLDLKALSARLNGR